MSNLSSQCHTQARILNFSLLLLGIGLASFAVTAYADTIDVLPSASIAHASPALSLPQCSGGSCSITQTTVADFNPGTFYLTGMTKNTQGGGDGDGEVRLLTFGISQADWKSASNVGAIPGLFGHAAAQKNGVIFVSGGKTSSAGNPVPSIYTTTIQSDHSLGTWSQSAVSLPVSMTYHSMVIIGNTLVVIGGFDTNGNALSTVYTATINANGSISSFQSAMPLPDGRYDFGVAVINGTIYVIGGATPSNPASSFVYYATPNPVSGAITTWFTATMSPPNPISKLTATSFNGRFYEIGGFDGSIFLPYVNFSQPSIGGDVATPNFTSTMPLNNNLIEASSDAFASQIYVIGGAQNNLSEGANTIYSAVISPTGELNDILGWAASPVLSSKRVRSPSVMSDDGWIYVLGGLTGSPGSQSALTSYDYGPTSGNNATSYAPYGTYTSPVIDVGGTYTVTNIAWNATITNSIGMSLTLQYYCGSSPNTLTSCSAPPSGATYGMLQTNNVSVSQTARYWKYVVNFTRGNTDAWSPILNWVRFDYNIPFYPDFAINGLVAPTAFSSPLTQTQLITYWVSNKRSLTAPVRNTSSATNSPKAPAKSTGGLKVPLSPTQTASPSRPNAPSSAKPTYLFYVYFYADPSPAPTAPMSVTNALPCIDANSLHPGGPFPPFIYYTLELYNTPSVFYAQCTVPRNAQNFWAQIDACQASDTPDCTTNGYVLELDETGSSPSYADNIIGPVPVGTSIGGGSTGGLGSFLPFIKRSP